MRVNSRSEGVVVACKVTSPRSIQVCSAKCEGGSLTSLQLRNISIAWGRDASMLDC